MVEAHTRALGDEEIREAILVPDGFKRPHEMLSKGQCPHQSSFSERPPAEGEGADGLGTRYRTDLGRLCPGSASWERAEFLLVLPFQNALSIHVHY